MGLTKKQVDGAKYRGSPNEDGAHPQDIRWDDDVPGFGLRLFPSGVKSFVLKYRTPEGKTRLMKLGRCGVLTVKQARNLAKVELSKVAQGRDPQRERRQKRSAGIKVSDFWKEYLKDYAKEHRRSWRDDERRYKREIKPVIGDRALWSVTQDDVRKIHQRVGQRAPTEANRVVELLRLMFNLALDWKDAPVGFENPARLAGKRKGMTGKGRVKRYREKSRTRWLKKDEVRRLLDALAEEEDLYAAAAIRLLLFTGLRKSELLNARWEHLDFERRELFVPNRKADQDFTLPLNSPALQLLTSLPRQVGSPWIFPSPLAPSEPRRDVKRQWDRVRKRAQLPDVRMHDLRRTAGSWMAQAGVPLAWIQEVLGQQSPEVVKVYARLAEETARAAVDTYADTLDAALNGKEAGQ